MSDAYGLEELWRCRCLSEANLIAIIEDRAYPQHISEIQGPTFPCLTLYTLADPVDFSLDTVVNGVYQMDGWAYVRQAAKNIQAVLEGMFQRENWSDDKVRILQSFMTNRGNVMFEPDTNLYHSYSIWNVRWLPI